MADSRRSPYVDLVIDRPWLTLLSVSLVFGVFALNIVQIRPSVSYKYLLARREKRLSTRAAIEYAYATVGPAILFTTIVLISGFLIMTFLAEFRVNSDMASMTSIVLAFALAFDLLALPALLLTIDAEKEIEPTTNLPQEA